MLIGMMGVLLGGCGHMARESEFYDHNTLYRNWDHAAFSMWVYKDPSAVDVTQSRSEDWWGIPDPLCTG